MTGIEPVSQSGTLPLHLTWAMGFLTSFSTLMNMEAIVSAETILTVYFRLLWCEKKSLKYDFLASLFVALSIHCGRCSLNESKNLQSSLLLAPMRCFTLQVWLTSDKMVETIFVLSRIKHRLLCSSTYERCWTARADKINGWATDKISVLLSGALFYRLPWVVMVMVVVWGTIVAMHYQPRRWHVSVRILSQSCVALVSYERFY